MFANTLNNMTLKNKIVTLILFMSTILIFTAALGLYGMSQSNAGLRTVYLDRTVCLDQIAEIMDLATDSIKLVQTQNSGQAIPLESFLKKIDENSNASKNLWQAYQTSYITPEEKRIADEFTSRQADFMTNGLNPAIDLLKQQQNAQAAELLIKMEPKFDLLMESADRLKAYQVKLAKEVFEQSSHQYQTMLVVNISGLVLTIFLAIGFGILMYHNIFRQLGIEPLYAMLIAKDIAKGKVNRDIKLEKGDTGSMLFHMKTMQDAINSFALAQHEMALKHADGWIKEQIDASQFFGAYKVMADEINDLVNSHIAVKMRVVDVIGRYAQGDFSVDMDRLPGEKAKITNSIDGVKASLQAISNQIKRLGEAGCRGDFSYRADTAEFSYMFKEMLEDFNKLMETSHTSFNDILRVSQTLAKGDLTQTITRDYPGTFGEVKEAINLTVENLKHLVEEIQSSSDTIGTAANEISSGNNDLSHRTEEQAASLEQTAASMEELTSTVQHNAENAKLANQFASGASDIAGQGVAVVEQVVATMGDITQSSHRIVDIISVIDDIAFQTNILALNAAVEAARAGDQGKGFAVVAIEVRNLAQRAAGAAGEIKRLIGDSVDKISDGSNQVAKAGHTMEDIVKAISKVTRIMDEITAASFEQSSGIAQVNQAISQMDDVTQQNAALVEQAAAAAESMAEQTQGLSKVVANFKLHGGDRVVGKSPSSPVVSIQSGNKPKTAKELPEMADVVGWEEF